MPQLLLDGGLHLSFERLAVPGVLFELIAFFRQLLLKLLVFFLVDRLLVALRGDLAVQPVELLLPLLHLFIEPGQLCQSGLSGFGAGRRLLPTLSKGLTLGNRYAQVQCFTGSSPVGNRCGNLLLQSGYALVSAILLSLQAGNFPGQIFPLALQLLQRLLPGAQALLGSGHIDLLILIDGWVFQGTAQRAWLTGL